MFVETINTVFLHVPKTAGNYVSSVFLDSGLTTETMEVHPHQDGFHRFAIVGEKTSYKHQSLVDYQKRFDRKQWRSLHFLSIWRDPLERLISFYLSPHRFQRQGVVVAPTDYDLDAFSEIVRTHPSTTQKLQTRTRRLPKNLTLLRFEHVRDDLEKFLDSKGYGLSTPVDVRNPTTSRVLFDQMMADDRVKRIVERSKHMADFNLPVR